MAAGHTVCINLPVKKGSNTRILLKKIGFKTIGKDILEQKLLSDGTVIIRLDQEQAFGPGLLYYSGDPDHGLPFSDVIPSAPDDEMTMEWVDPNGVSVAVAGAPVSGIPAMISVENPAFGEFYEVSIMTKDFNESYHWWLEAGFELTYGNPATDNFLTMSDGLINIGLYRPGSCPHIFNNPAITYFDAHMKEKLVIAKSKGIDFAQEIPNREGNITDGIVETEEGYHVFLFSA